MLILTIIQWWRHQMEAFSALLALCEGNPLVTGGSPHKGQWRRALMFSLISAWTNGWTNNRDPGDLRRCPARYDVTVMFSNNLFRLSWSSSFHRLLPMTVMIMDIIFEKKKSFKFAHGNLKKNMIKFKPYLVRHCSDHIINTGLTLKHLISEHRLLTVLEVLNSILNGI